MGDHGAVADAGDTLVKLLRDRMTLLSDEQIVLASPVDKDLKNKVRLTVFLFDVERSTPSGATQQFDSPDGTPTGEPVQLDLKYLLTALPVQGNGSTTTTERSKNEHAVLGRAMQILHDNAIVDGSDLQGSLEAGDEALRVSMVSQTTDRIMNLWNTFREEPYHPSVTYLVTPVEIESRREMAVERVQQFQVTEHIPASDEDE